ncbi:uncharacterized protein [Clytia hemisphaerica]|uniref:Uncharacterized protein n=1 Tax=Clytia hemisphaerica TaxID=252671 RepID=A0A7M5XIF9_9CNID
MLRLVILIQLVCLIRVEGDVSTIHLSPNGVDEPECGDILHKCQTIEYGFNQTDHINDISLVFETSPVESLQYRFTNQLQINNNKSVILSLIKDDPKGADPIIYGNNHSFIGVRQGEIEISIDSIDLYNVMLLDSKENHASVVINIRASSIYINQSNFISLKQAKKAFITIEHCNLKSPFIIEGQQIIIDKYQWLDVVMNEDSNNQSQIMITDTKISGGRFQIKNVQSFHVKNCRIDDNIPRIPTEFVVQSSQFYEFKARFPEFQNDSRDTINTTILEAIIPHSLIDLQNTRDVLIENCTFQRLVVKRMIKTEKVSGSIKNIHFHHNLDFYKIIESRESNIKLTGIQVEAFFMALNCIPFDFTDSTGTLENISLSSNEKLHSIFQSKRSFIYMNNFTITDVQVSTVMFMLYTTDIKIVDLQILRAQIDDKIFKSSNYYRQGVIEAINLSIQDSITNRECFRLARTDLLLTNLTIINTYFGFDVINPYIGRVSLTNTKIDRCQFESHFFRAVLYTKIDVNNLQIRNTNITEHLFYLFYTDLVNITDLTVVNTNFLAEGFFFEECINIHLNRVYMINSSFWKSIFLMKQKTDVYMNGLQLHNITMENIFMASESILNIANLNLTSLKFKRSYPESIDSMNGFNFLKNSLVNISNLFLAHCKIDLYLFLVTNSDIIITKTYIKNNEFSTLLRSSTSKVKMVDLISDLNEESRRTKFIIAESSSIISLTRTYVYIAALMSYERITELIDTELYTNNVNFYANGSKSLQFQIMKWDFAKQTHSNLTAFMFQCPQNFKPVLKFSRKSDDSLRLGCQKCEQNTYPTNRLGKQMNLTTRLDRTKNIILDNVQTTTLQCQTCPTGAICEDGAIKARDNFYGFANEYREYEFVLCPEGYCCSLDTSPCVTPTTCSSNRTGLLCGSCEKDHFLNLNNQCVHNSKCTKKSQHIYWILFLAVPMTLSFLMTFAKDLKYLVIRFILWVNCCKQENHKNSQVVKPKSITVEKPNTIRKEISFTAIFNIVMTFYQLKALITVKGVNESNNNNNLGIDQIFNIEWITKGREELKHLCSFKGMTVTTNMFLIGYGSPIIMLLTVVFCLLICKLINRLRCNKDTDRTLFTGRFYVGYYIVLAFCYKNVCHNAFSFVNCKTMNGRRFLYIDGSIECFHYWQIVNIVFLILWVFSFPIAVAIGYQKLKNREISRLKFMMLLTVPCGAFFLIACKKFIKKDNRHLHQKADDRLVEMFELPYKEKYIWWEAWRLMERFIIAGLSVFLTNPIYRILYITSLFALFWYLHKRINPYKRSMFILKRLDSVSWVCLFLLSLFNEMRAVAYIYNIPNVDSINYALKAANVFEQLFSPLWYFMISLIIRKLRS